MYYIRTCMALLPLGCIVFVRLSTHIRLCMKSRPSSSSSTASSVRLGSFSARRGAPSAATAHRAHFSRRRAKAAASRRTRSANLATTSSAFCHWPLRVPAASTASPAQRASSLAPRTRTTRSAKTARWAGRQVARQRCATRSVPRASTWPRSSGVRKPSRSALCARLGATSR